MTEFTVRRIVIACDAACDIRLAVEEGAALAVRWKAAALHGVFLEDVNLFRLAGLPFGRQTTLSSAVSESLRAADLEELSSVLSAAMRRELAQAAAQRGLEWSFGVVRDLPSVAALAGIEGDILVVHSVTRAFSGSWRPRSFWDMLPEDHARTILIRRRSQRGAGTVLTLLGKHDDRESILLSGFVMAGPEDEVVVLLQDGSPSDLEAVQRIAASLAMERRKIRWEATPADMPTLLRQIERLEPALIVIDAGQTDPDVVRDLLARTGCDVLLVRSPRLSNG
jgi:hypothetical protein